MKYVIAALVTACAQAALGQATFTGVGIPAGFTRTGLDGLSGDGTIAVGTTIPVNADPWEARGFRWTAEAGLELLDQAGAHGSSTNGISLDGGVIVGECNNYKGQFNATPVRWPNGGALDRFLGASVEARTTAVSNGGAVIVGHSFNGLFMSGYRYDAVNDVVTPLGAPTGTYRPNTEAYAISANGQRIAGSSFTPTGNFAVYWEGTSSQPTVLGILPGDAISKARAMSPEGDVIVGVSVRTSFSRAFVWQNNVMAALAEPGNGESSSASAVSNRGSVIGGSAGTGGASRAVIWTADGIADLKSYLEASGAVVTGWQLQSVAGISADGRTIAGSGTNPQGQREGWIATLGTSCPADFDGDGFVTGADYDAYVQAFEAGDMSSDFDDDGFITGADFDLYVAAFEKGC